MKPLAQSIQESETADRVPVWRCIGCGRIEATQPCIGVCQDVRVDMVAAADYDVLAARLKSALEEAAQLRAIVSRIARTTPRAGGWESTYRALQADARRALAADASTN